MKEQNLIVLNDATTKVIKEKSWEVKLAETKSSTWSEQKLVEMIFVIKVEI